MAVPHSQNGQPAVSSVNSPSSPASTNLPAAFPVLAPADVAKVPEGHIANFDFHNALP
jgi:hypothetical protein